MLNTIRGIVSGNKARYQEDGFDLDLVRITDRIIIMGYPAAGVASLYRNKRSDVLRFLEPYAPHYRIFNLCPLYENSYDPTAIVHKKATAAGDVERYPWPDHHPPPLSLFRIMVAGAKEWYEQDERNVIVIHCKAGKGRSGTFAISILLALSGLPSAPSSTRHHPLSEPSSLSSSSPRQEDDNGQLARTGEAEDATDPTTTRDLAGETSASLTRAEVERSGTTHDRLEWLLKFHTERRMKPGVKHLGVSISSQRRFLGYWARLLDGDDPRSSSPPITTTTATRGKRLVVLEYVRVVGPGLKGPKARFAGVGNDKIAVQVWRYKDSIADTLRQRELDLVRDDSERDPGGVAVDWDDRDKMFVHAGGFVEQQQQQQQQQEGGPQRPSEERRPSGSGPRVPMDPLPSSSTSTLELPNEVAGERALEEYASTADTVSPFPSRSPSPSPSPSRAAPSARPDGVEPNAKLLVPHTAYLAPGGSPSPPESRSGSGSDSDAQARVATDGGIVVDADREVMLKFLVGETGKKHGKLPTMAALAITWFVPVFEIDPTGARSGQTSRLTLGARDLDFVKSFAGIDSVEIGWRWL
ncbi:hypothetical protein JCM11491_000708 [Sporobolomyces phaffii]